MNKQPTWEESKEQAFAEIALRIETNHTDWPWIRASIFSLLITHDQELIERIEGMKGMKWVEHGRDCNDQIRPCGAVEHPERLADRCEIHSFDQTTLTNVLQLIRGN